MSRRIHYYAAIFILLMGSSLWALDVRTTINSIAHEGNNQVLGIFTIVVDGNSFPNASPTNPVYIRFRMVQSNGWSNTLVDLRPDSGDAINQAINLAISPPSNGTPLNGSLAPNSVQLVRLIQGEKEGWIKITQPTSSWLTGNEAPSPEESVSFTIGIKGVDSIQAGTNTVSGGNERETNHHTASTVLRANYRDTPFFGNGDLEILDFVGYDATTDGVETGNAISTGAILAFGFSNDLAVARGTFNFPCLDYHFDPENFEASFHQVGISRINLTDFRKYEFNVPPVYLTNTSDFPWEVGTNLFLTHQSFEPDFVLAGVNHPGTMDTEAYPVRLVESDIKLDFTGDGTWEVSTVYWGDNVAGYRLILTDGLFSLNDRLTINGMRAFVSEDFENRSMILSAEGFYRHHQITQGDLKNIGPIARKTVELNATETILSRKVVPYTAYDQESWEFNLHLLNPNDVPLHYTALFYNRHGILLRILGNQTLAANTKRQMNIGELFGAQAQGILSWVEIMSEQDFQALGEIRNDDLGLLDIFPANDDLQQTLYGLHLPSETQTWQTTAYVLSADLSVDTEFNMMFPESPAFRVNNIFLPGGTAILSDNLFVNQNGRQPWFQVDTSSERGAGLLFYNRQDDAPQLVSVLMNVTPANSWRFDHLGNPSGGWWNGLVLFNPNEDPLQITVRGLNEINEPLGETSFSIPPKSKHIALANQMIQTAGAGPISMLQATSNQPFLSFLLLGRQDQPLLTRVSGNVPKSSKFRLGYLPRTSEEWLGLALFNPQPEAQTAVVTLMDAEGVAGPSETLTLPAFGKSIFDLQTLFGDLFTQYAHLDIQAEADIRVFGITGDHDATQLATIDPQPISP